MIKQLYNIYHFKHKLKSDFNILDCAYHYKIINPTEYKPAYVGYNQIKFLDAFGYFDRKVGQAWIYNSSVSNFYFNGIIQSKENVVIKLTNDINILKRQLDSLT